jgi:hypothetical protein
MGDLERLEKLLSTISVYRWVNKSSERREDPGRSEKVGWVVRQKWVSLHLSQTS